MKRKIGFVAVASLMAAMPIMSCSATNAGVELEGEKITSVDFTRVVLGVSNSFSNSFNYEIVASDANPAPVSGLVDNFSIGFTEADAILNNSVSKVATIDLSSVVFSKLGDYEFVVKEVSSTDPVNYPVDNDNEYTLVASVRNALDESGEPTGELESSFAAQVKKSDGSKVADAKYSKAAVRGKIEISNTLQGSMADSGAYFKYKVNITSGKEGDIYTIAGQDAEVEYGGETILTQSVYIVGQENYVYLKHGQTATIGVNGELNELPIGVQYSVQELDATDYETLIDGEVDEDKGTDFKTVQADLAGDASEDEIAAYKESNMTDFKNKKEANVLTGVMLSVLPFAIAGAVGLAGYAVSKNKKD